MYELRNGALKIAFPENGGGMPETITLLEADQTEVPEEAKKPSVNMVPSGWSS